MKNLLTILLIILPLSAYAWGVVATSGGVAAPAGECTGTIGNTATTDADGVSGENRIVLQQITSTCTDASWDMYIRISYFNGEGRSGTYVLYSDNGSDAPNVLLESHPFAYDATTEAHWVHATFTTSLTNGTKYWIGFTVQYVGSIVMYSSTSGGVSYRGYVSNYASPPAWSSVTNTFSQTSNMEMYVKYDN